MVYTIDPEDHELRFHLTNVGRAALQDQNYSIARDAFVYLQRIASGHVAVAGGLCQSLVGLKHMREALPWCEQAVQDSPKHLSYLAQLALVQLRLGQLELALTWAQRTVELSPDWAFAHRLLGDIYCAMGNLPKAASAYQKALTLAPQDPTTQQQLNRLNTCQP